MPYFMQTPVNVVSNTRLRKPQIEAYIKIQEYFATNPSGEALVVLPTGTGKSGLVSIAPYGVANGRVLIITPGLVTKQSIKKTQEPLQDNFWVNYDVIFNPTHLPVVTEYRSDVSDEHLRQSHFVISNIHKLTTGRSSRALISRVDPDFFDMIIVDEAHHAPAQSWREVLAYFRSAKKLHLTGTPYRGDNQEVPGEQIHETPLSEVMRDRYVKWLRKETVNAQELYFTIPDQPGRHFSKDEVLELRDREWVERSVALAESCSRDVINHSVQKFKEFKAASPAVPHKILAVGCSIAHAEDLRRWYGETGLTSVIVHSEMTEDERLLAFQAVDRHDCEVVVSVNMLMEGYDHQYLSTLAIFRPYRSLNAFAQIVGRVLRAIPVEETAAFEIDNNAVVVYHGEIGLDSMWEVFQKEVNRARRARVREYTESELEYGQRENTLGNVASENAFASDSDSYLADMDFNQLFAQKRAEIQLNADTKLDELRKLGWSEEQIAATKNALIRGETQKAAEQFDPLLIEKRPDQARKAMREALKQKIGNEATNILCDLNLSEKGSELAPKFSSILYQLPSKMANDGVLVWFINNKLHKKFGKIDQRDNKTLLRSIEAVPGIVAELRKMLS